MSVVHLAGNQVTVGDYAIQRCLLCGEVMDEFNSRNLASPDGNPLTSLAVGGFYEFDDNHILLIRETDTPHFSSDLDLPDNCCLRQRDMT